MLTVATILVIRLSFGQQTCLQEPPVLNWDDSTGVSSGILTFDSVRFDSVQTGFPISFTTRVHNGRIPSPTLKFERGLEYHLKLVNNLSPQPLSTIPNTIKNLQWTNVHTHGLHISGETPGDNIFDKINGGENMTYVYNFPCDHAGGTFWYHPHVHGSTSVQVGGGAVGAIIVEDSAEEQLEPWLTSMQDYVMVIQHLDLRRVRQIGQGIDTVFQTDNFGANTDFWIINGEYLPSICMITGKWMRFRIVNSDLRRPNEYTIDADGGSNSPCKVYLIAKDGVLIHGENNEVPREITTRTMYFTTASRADVAVKCDQSGTYSITTSAANGGNRDIGFLSVTDPLLPVDDIPLTTFNPLRPQYLHSLINIDPAEWITNGGQYNTESVSINRLDVTVDPQRRFAINGQLFAGEDSNIFSNNLQSGSLQQWTLIGINAHPFHIHVNHFQIVSQGTIGTDPNWTETGDWLDVINEQALIRFITDRYGGNVMMHCHILEHEDRGTMAVTYIEGGCDAVGGDISSSIAGATSCDDTQNCEQPFFI